MRKTIAGTMVALTLMTAAPLAAQARAPQPPLNLAPAPQVSPFEGTKPQKKCWKEQLKIIAGYVENGIIESQAELEGYYNGATKYCKNKY
ncbi:MAG: hypothetical protein JWM47_2607 [Acidimicrobiales bacterium]|nr:hypothetical protein [Acidimicrobiales bacterium]